MKADSSTSLIKGLGLANRLKTVPWVTKKSEASLTPRPHQCIFKSNRLRLRPKRTKIFSPSRAFCFVFTCPQFPSKTNHVRLIRFSLCTLKSREGFLCSRQAQLKKRWQNKYDTRKKANIPKIKTRLLLKPIYFSFIVIFIKRLFIRCIKKQLRES